VESPFHKALHHFTDKFRERGTPLLHLDFHGKKNRKNNLNLDIGSTALRNDWWGGDAFCSACLEQLRC